MPHSTHLRLSLCVSLAALASVAIIAPSLDAANHEMNPIADPPAGRMTAIVNARLIDGNGGPPIEKACVIVQGNTIRYAGVESRADIANSAVRFDAEGKSLLPGLVDTHFHSRDSAKTPIGYELENGITSFRDPGHPFKFYDWMSTSESVIPRVFLCGGHLDAAPPVWPTQAVVIAGEQDATDAVNDHVRRGASAIKVYLRLPLDHIRAACEAAKSHGIPVTAHLELIKADEAIAAGVDGIEHLTSFGTVLAEPEQAKVFEEVITANSEARREWRPRLWQGIRLDANPRLDPLVDLVVARGTFVSPTLAIFEARGGLQNATPTTVQAFETMLEFFAILQRRGAKIVVGSHTGAPFAAGGKAYLREVELMAEAGMEPLRIITAATKTGSEFLGVQDRLGTIDTGKLADLILIDGRPDKNISDIDKVTHVMLNGTWVKGTADR